MMPAQSSRRVSAAFAAIVSSLIAVAAFDPPLSSQAPPKISYVRDVQPILQERCVGCHGPSRQMSGYRLDRRSTALGGVIRHNIVPGSSDTSRLYLRISGTQVGVQMPPAGALPSEEIAVLKRWIDEGAEWPAALANEADPPQPDPEAIRLVEAMRKSGVDAALKEQRDLRSVVNRRGPGGSTPLMYAVLYGDARALSDMVRAGADPNLRNDVGASALMWAIDDVDKVRVLLEAGADVNATSDFDRTPLALAAAHAGSAPVVGLLLDHGAKPSPAALASAALQENPAAVRILLSAGGGDTVAAAIAALRSGCRECLDAIDTAQRVPALRGALMILLPAPGPGNGDALREAIARGADVTVKDTKSRTVLMRAAIAETMPPDAVQLLIDHGADVHAKTAEGLTALDFARRLGHTAVVDVLTRAGATASSEADPALTYVRTNTARAAVARALPLLQRTALQFYAKSGCVSCHHNSLTEMTMAAAAAKGFNVDERSVRADFTQVVNDIETTSDQALQGIVASGGLTTTTGYTLMGVAAGHQQSDFATDAMVRVLRLSQHPDGHWLSAFRPPIEASVFTATAVGLRGIQLYGPAAWKDANERAIRLAESWLTAAHPSTTEDRVFRLFGLTWAHAARSIRQSALDDLVATQHADGGWAQLSTLQSDAYATGQSLVALSEAGMRPDNSVYRRGVEFLVKTQVADGSWFVKTRSHPTQVYFESGFPHGRNQYISAAATNWATLALVRARESASHDDHIKRGAPAARVK